MRIGIVVYSRTGHTLSVAEKLGERLRLLGHTTTLVRLRHDPVDCEPFDGLAFCSPVYGGMSPDEMKDLLERLPALHGKNTVCLATGILPAKVGRNQTLAYMKDICEQKGARVRGVGSVNWMNPARNQWIERLVDDLSTSLTAP